MSLTISKLPEPKKTSELPVLQEIETSKGSLILLDPGASKEPTFENLFLRRHGRIKWRAQLPQSHDAFVSVNLTESGEIEAQTWQGLLVKVDLETGKTTKKEFVK
jgi:hypothetical protein